MIWSLRESLDLAKKQLQQSDSRIKAEQALLSRLEQLNLSHEQEHELAKDLYQYLISKNKWPALCVELSTKVNVSSKNIGEKS